MVNNSKFCSYCFVVMALLVFVGCDSKKSVSVRELKSFVLDPENGLLKESKGENFSITLFYQPKDLILFQEAGIDDPALWDSTANRLKPYDYFVLQISQSGKAIEHNYVGNPSRYKQVVSYLSGGIANDLRLTINNKHINATDVLFTPVYGMADRSSILLIFESSILQQEKDFGIELEDGLLGLGKQTFNFEYKHLANIPKLQR